MTIPRNGANASTPTRKPRKRLLTFNDPMPLRVDRRLATEIGFLESLVLLQIEYHISTTDNLRDGEYWTYQTLKDLHEWDFPWLSMATISRTLSSLEDLRLIKKGNYNKRKSDRTIWYALDFDGVSKLSSIGVGEDVAILQNANRTLQSDKSILHDETSTLHDDTTLPDDSPNQDTEKTPNHTEGSLSLLDEEKKRRNVQRLSADDLVEMCGQYGIAAVQAAMREKLDEAKKQGRDTRSLEGIYREVDRRARGAAQ